jgi:hypothetical protein
VGLAGLADPKDVRMKKKEALKYSTEMFALLAT